MNQKEQLPQPVDGFRVWIATGHTCPCCGSPYAPVDRQTGRMAQHESSVSSRCTGIGLAPTVTYREIFIRENIIRQHLNRLEPKMIAEFIDLLKDLPTNICSRILYEVMNLTGIQLSQYIQGLLSTRQK